LPNRSTTQPRPTRRDPELSFRRGLRLLPPDVHPGLLLWLRRLRHGRGRDFWEMDGRGRWRSL